MAVSTRQVRLFTIAVAFAACAVAAASSQAPADPVPVEVRGGTCSFDVDTNVPAVNVHGKSTALQARVRLRRTAEGPVLEQIEAVVPVKTLETGMGLRDEHMRKYVFTTSDGQTPDVRFVGRKTTCAQSSANQSTCEVAGDLVIRGTARPFTVALKVVERNGEFHASGDSVVKLSTYGIPQPSQLGVKTSDDVKVKFDFTARPAPVATTGAVR